MFLWLLVGLFAAAVLLGAVGLRLRLRRARAPRVPLPAAAASRAHCDRSGDDSSDDGDDGDGDGGGGAAGGLRRRRAASGGREGAVRSRLQRKKMEKAREAAARAEAREERRAAQDSAARQREASQERRERESAAREAAAEEALEELRAERRRREDEEYAKWVGDIGVEERGEIGDEERVRRDRVDAFLTERAQEVDARAAQEAREEAQDGAANIIVLGDTARSLCVSAEVLAQRIERLLADGVVNGVFDDRGKFVFIAEVHFRRLATFLQQRGRVSVRELARECNRVILA